jgi:hypothetical protein
MQGVQRRCPEEICIEMGTADPTLGPSLILEIPFHFFSNAKYLPQVLTMRRVGLIVRVSLAHGVDDEDR